jgi:hypothetical protein
MAVHLRLSPATAGFGAGPHPPQAHQRQAEIAHPEQHPVQGGLIGKLGLAVRQVGEDQAFEPGRPRRPEVALDPDLVAAMLGCAGIMGRRFPDLLPGPRPLAAVDGRAGSLEPGVLRASSWPSGAGRVPRCSGH